MEPICNELEEISSNGVEVEGEVYEVIIKNTLDMSSMWSAFGQGGGNDILFCTHCLMNSNEKLFLQYEKDGCWEDFRCDVDDAPDIAKNYDIRTIKRKIEEPVNFLN